MEEPNWAKWAPLLAIIKCTMPMADPFSARLIWSGAGSGHVLPILPLVSMPNHKARPILNVKSECPDVIEHGEITHSWKQVYGIDSKQKLYLNVRIKDGCKWTSGHVDASCRSNGQVWMVEFWIKCRGRCLKWKLCRTAYTCQIFLIQICYNCVPKI